MKPLAEKVGASLVLPCDVEDSASIDSVFDTLAAEWGKLDFIVHAIGFSDKNELKGLYADTTRENFIRTMVISCYSFTEIARKRGRADERRRIDDDADLWRLDAGHAELQRHGCRQGRRWKPACAISPTTTARAASA